MKTLNIYTDGGSRGNPGDAAIGVVICDNQHCVIFRWARYIGDRKTNNEAEYMAFIAAGQILAKNYPEIKKVNFYSDSQLVVNQLNGIWRIKKFHLRKLNGKFIEQIQHLKVVRYQWVSRTHPHIALADALLNEKLDEHLIDNMLNL